jgi:uncharacterized protein (DUF58 family)
VSSALRRLAPYGLPLLVLGGIALAPGPLWLYAGRLALVFLLAASCGWLLAGRTRAKVEVLTLGPEAGDFVELEAVWQGFFPGFWRVAIRDGPELRVHEGWFGVGRLRLRWVEKNVRRGVHLYEVTLAYRDPLGILTRTLAREARLAVAVRPRAVALSLRRLQGGGDDSLRGVRRIEEQREFAGVRRYEAGDRLGRLHWPQTVRTGRLQVRQTLRSGELLREIVLDVDRRDYPDPELFELAVSVAASFALTLAREGSRVALHAGRCSVQEGMGNAARLMEALTAVELEHRPMPLAVGRRTLFVGPSDAARSFKGANPGAMVAAVGEGRRADISVPNFAALWRLGRRVRP